MIDDRPTFHSGVIRPMECLRGGWALIKDDYWLFMGIAVLGVIIASVAPFGILAGPMLCGIYICLLRRHDGKRVKFEMLFKGFDHFVQSFIATLIMMVPILVVMVPCYIAFIAVMMAQMPPPGQKAPPPNADALGTILGAYALFILVMLAISIVVSILFFFTYPLIVDRKLTGVQAVGLSIRAARANLGGLIGLVLLLNLLGILGVMACYIGAFFLLPVHFAAVAFAYRKVFPDLDDESSSSVREPERMDEDD